MDRFCVITNSDKDKEYRTAGYIKDYITGRGRSCVVTQDCTCFRQSGIRYTDTEEIPADTECAIVLGGDGTFIQAASDLVHRDIPILGVNLGTLGFLAEIERQSIDAALEALFRGEYRTESRMMIRGCVESREEMMVSSYALNDIVINRSGLGHLTSVKLYVNKELIDTYVGDGIIVSTPTGSTGYNLSAGGPIMAPSIKAMVISPICPHSLNKRSLVVSSDDEVILRIGQCKTNMEDEGVAIFDGRIASRMRTGDQIVINRANVDTKVIKLFDTSFFEILRNKLGREKE